MPTGTGKTEVALAAMAQTRTATLVVAPIRDLMYQWHRRILKGLGYDAGIVGDNTFNLRPLTVTTYDSACIHMAQIGARFGLLIFDEEHHLPGPTYREAAIMSTAAMRLGLTATPERYDGRHVDLDWLIGPVAYHMPFQQARGATLADFAVVRIPVHLSPDEQASYDQCSRQVRHFIAERRREQPGYSWQDLCGESGKDPAARTGLEGATTSSRRSRTGRRRSFASWRTSSGCTRGRRPSSSPAPTRWRWRFRGGSCCPRSSPTPARRNGWPCWTGFRGTSSP